MRWGEYSFQMKSPTAVPIGCSECRPVVCPYVRRHPSRNDTPAGDSMRYTLDKILFIRWLFTRLSIYIGAIRAFTFLALSVVTPLCHRVVPSPTATPA